MVVGSPDNFGRTRELGFSVQGFKSRQRRKVLEQMRPGDNLVYYVSQAQAFGATARDRERRLRGPRTHLAVEAG